MISEPTTKLDLARLKAKLDIARGIWKWGAVAAAMLRVVFLVLVDVPSDSSIGRSGLLQVAVRLLLVAGLVSVGGRDSVCLPG